jgi:hypothetical protein
MASGTENVGDFLEVPDEKEASEQECGDVTDKVVYHGQLVEEYVLGRVYLDGRRWRA